MSLEINTIFSNLLFNESYARKVIPFLKEDYFSDQADKTLFGLIEDYVHKYNAFPSKEALTIDLSNKTGISEITFKEVTETIKNLSVDENTKLDWLLDTTEKFCQERAIYNAIMSSIQILDDKKTTEGKGSIPKIL